MAKNSTKNPYGARNTFYGLIINLITITLWWWLWLHHHVINNFPFRNNTNNTQNHTHLHIGFSCALIRQSSGCGMLLGDGFPYLHCMSFRISSSRCKIWRGFVAFNLIVVSDDPHTSTCQFHFTYYYERTQYLPIDVFTCSLSSAWSECGSSRMEERLREKSQAIEETTSNKYNLTRARCVRVYEFHSAEYVCHFHVQLRL